MKIIKTMLRPILRRCGIHVTRLKYARAGIDISVDLMRLGKGEPAVIFDIGANCGQTALKFHRRWPLAKIHSFEPFPTAFAALSGLDIPNVRAIRKALGSKTETVEACESERAEMNSLVSNFAGGTHKVTIDVTTVDSYCASEGIDRIDLLKTDTEGYELEVIKGAGEMLASGRIGAVLVETTFIRGAGLHVHFCDLLAALEPRGFVPAGFHDVILDHRGFDYGNVLFVKV